MEKKRKLPARAATRSEPAAKKRSVATPSTERSLTPVPAQTPAEESPSPTQQDQEQQQFRQKLPTSVQPGKPLPTVDEPQRQDLSYSDYQSLQESGVVAEALLQSRKIWMEGMFEKYWSKPSRKKGVVEDAGNPAKDSMTRLGVVTIKVEPHIFDAVMFSVKDPKPPQPSAQAGTSHANAGFRPTIQHGPPNGVLLPPLDASRNLAAKSKLSKSFSKSSKSSSSTPQQGPAKAPMHDAANAGSSHSSPAPKQELSRPPTTTSLDGNPQARDSPSQPSPLTAAAATSPSQPISRTMSGQSHFPLPSPSARPVRSPPQPDHAPHTAPPPPPAPPVAAPAPHPPPASGPGLASAPVAPPALAPMPATPSAPTAAPAPALKPPAAPQVPGGKPPDPIIAILAERASFDAQLRDIMKKVAGGSATPDELTNFQRVIDSISSEFKRKNGHQGLSPDKLIVAGRTVTDYANEVRTIVDIVLASNPNQRGSTLKPPKGADPLIFSLVKFALDDTKTRDIVRRIAEKKPNYSDASDLKAVLDRIHKTVATATADRSKQPSPSAAQPEHGNKVPDEPPSHPFPTPPGSQLLRSKPSLPARPDIAGIVFEFVGGNGDRYLFPKFSFLQYEPDGLQVIASFLIVRRGSPDDCGGDPALDYWEPVTMRISGRHVEHLRRVVAPEADVKRYVGDVKRRMTRAEFVLLAMRLPREKDRNKEEPVEEMNSAVAAPRDDLKLQPLRPQNGNTISTVATNFGGVLWITKSSRPAVSAAPPPKRTALPTDENKQRLRYSKFINTVASKEPEAV